MNPYSIIDKYYPPSLLRDILITHSRKVAYKALEAARESGLPFNPDLIETGALLHDIGIFLCDAPDIECRGTEPYIRHGLLGGELLRKEGYPLLARFSERHTGAGLTAEEIKSQGLPLPPQDFLPETIEEKAVCYADKFFSKSAPGISRVATHEFLEAIAREKPLDKVIASMRRHGASSLTRFMEMHRMFNPNVD